MILTHAAGTVGFTKPILQDSGLCGNEELDSVAIGVGADEVCEHWSPKIESREQ